MSWGRSSPRIGCGQRAMAARSATEGDDAILDNTALFEKELDFDLDDFFEDDEDVAEQWAELKRRHFERKAKQAASAPPVAASKWASESSGSAAGPSGASGGRPQRKFIAREANGYSQKAAMRFLPPGAKISKDDKRENRWRIRAAYLKDFDGGGGGERSKSYGKASPLGDFGAMIFVLKLGWRAYLAAHGGECPWQWEEL